MGGGGGGGSGGSQSPSWKSNGGSRSISRSVLGKRFHSSTIDGGSKGSTMRKDQSENSLLQSEHPNGTVTSPPPDDRRRHHQQGKSNGEEWPRIHIGLSRKEKEEDFLAMKATKLPHRPKKRSKAVDRNLQLIRRCIFLVMWFHFRQMGWRLYTAYDDYRVNYLPSFPQSGHQHIHLMQVTKAAKARRIERPGEHGQLF